MAAFDNKSTRELQQVGVALEKGLRSENQDMYLVELLAVPGAPAMLLVGVFDGHGTFGRVCASTTRDLMQGELLGETTALKAVAQELPEAQAELTSLFARTQQKLVALADDKTAKCNAKFSGTTVVLAMVSSESICIANVGDSDCVLGSVRDGAPVATLLNTRHQLTIESEAHRIVAAGGRVETQRSRAGKQMDGPLRVWLKEVQTPGLMVSRSIGDYVCHDIGVSHEPCIVTRRVEPDDTLLVLGSDGLFEFVKNEDCVAFAEDFADPKEAAHGLTMLAMSRQSSQNADNITCVIVYLESPKARHARLSERAGWKQALETRREEVRALEKQCEALRDEQKKALMSAMKGGDGPSTGSIIYGGEEKDDDSKSKDAAAKPGKAAPESQDDDEDRPKKSSACVVC
jgi:serine/threonine protein phosphatase PrpC